MVGFCLPYSKESPNRFTEFKNKYGGKVGSEIHLEGWNNRSAYLEDRTFHVYFEWDEDFGTPGTVLVHNPYESEFYLKTITLQEVPGRGPIHFVILGFTKTKGAVFSSLPREEELRMLRGNGEGKLKEWDRVYDYAVYNDLGRLPVLGGSHEYPYRRRGRTGRPILGKDGKQKLQIRYVFNIYVPRDEQISRHKKSEFRGNNWKSLIQAVSPGIEAYLNFISRNEFDSFQEINNVYDDGTSNVLDSFTSGIFRAISRKGKFPLPQVIKEFTREMIAGLNPLLIRLLKDIQSNLDGLSVEQALKNKRLFILDHHDSVMPYLWKINKETKTKTYASRTLFFLRYDNTVKSVAIELSSSNEKRDKFGAVNKV
ncbi:putative linoleate 9S-lipoxygenase 5 isoform X1 [Gossypium australe]|uniref:Putative linoleate 9S-lipoxygenase 5 isoform X1 n=1 Tax=Gossypium australe TaxID=47621 RepID=A0A5B6VI26_9ROSI|nr:putative linoleate 9S-lipoxygenase 5 isoform X1 [Gossypium australe]